MDLAGFTVSDAIDLPPRTDYGIGVIGCGGIVNYAHLPAYRSAGFRVVACYDQSPEVAQRTATEHEVAHVATSVAEIMADPNVDIVDLAVTPWAQAAIAKDAILAGKHVLCQKPLADTYAGALEVVELAHQCDVKLAVNQQMRWDAGIAVSRQLIEQGAIGTPADARIETSIRTPWHMWPWMANSPRLEIMYHSIHYQD
jgi:predicted dehydrogenase